MPSSIEHANDSSRRKPWVKRRRRLLLLLTLLIVAPVSVVIGVHNFSNSRYEARVEAIRASGAPVNAKEIPEWIVKKAPVSKPDAGEITLPEPEDDSIALYFQAFDALEKIRNSPGMPNIGDLLTKLSKNGTLTEAELADLRKYLAANEDILALLLDAAKRSPGRIPLDYSKGYNVELPHLAKMREADRLLSGAAYLAALEGDRDRAFEAIMAGIAVHRPLEQEPILISQLVRHACNGITLQTFNDTVGLVKYTDEQLAQIQRGIEASNDPMALSNALVTERVFGIEMFDNPAQIIASKKTFLDDLIPDATATLMQTASAVGMFDGDRDEYLTCMDGMIQSLTLPYPESRTEMERIAGQVGESLLLPNLSQTLIPALQKLPDSIAANDARVETCSTAAAIERYALANGAPPAQLEALVPQYMREVPRDPFDQQPLRYRSDGNGYTLYSVGYNGTDDGGAPLGGNHEGDIVFRRQ